MLKSITREIDVLSSCLFTFWMLHTNLKIVVFSSLVSTFNIFSFLPVLVFVNLRFVVAVLGSTNHFKLGMPMAQKYFPIFHYTV